MYLNNNVIFTFVISMVLRFPARNAQIKVHKLVVNACTDYFLNLERDGLLASSIYFISFFFSNLIGFCNFYFGCLFWFYNLGGLDSRDQSRSRLRSSFVSRLTFENRREYPSCQDQLFFFLGRDLSLSRYLSRSLRQIETVKIYRDCQDLLRLSRFMENFRDFST